jgi:invasion protein IalB
MTSTGMPSFLLGVIAALAVALALLRPDAAAAQDTPAAPAAAAEPAAGDAGGAAEPPAEAETSPEPWTVVCPDAAADAAVAADGEEAGRCVMTQRLSAKPDGPRILQVYVRRLTTEEAAAAESDGASARVARLRVDLPFGLELAAGVELRIDGEAWTKAPIRTCLAGGCVALLLLTDEELTRLKRGGRMGVVVKAYDGRVIAWPVSLAGFTAAHAKLEAAGQ